MISDYEEHGVFFFVTQDHLLSPMILLYMVVYVFRFL